MISSRKIKAAAFGLAIAVISTGSISTSFGNPSGIGGGGSPAPTPTPTPTSTPTPTPTATQTPTPTPSPSTKPSPLASSGKIKIGQPIQSEVPPLLVGFEVTIPIASSDVFPKLTKKPLSLVKYNKPFNSGANINLKSLSVRAVRLTPGILLGGIPSSQLSDTPLADVSSERSEVQTASNLPTRISVGGLKSKSIANVVLITTDGSTFPLGRLKTSWSGRLTLPPVTVEKINIASTFVISSEGKVIYVTLRSTK